MDNDLSRFFSNSQSLFKFTLSVGPARIGAALTKRGLIIGFRRGADAGWFLALGRFSVT